MIEPITALFCKFIYFLNVFRHRSALTPDLATKGTPLRHLNAFGLLKKSF